MCHLRLGGTDISNAHHASCPPLLLPSHCPDVPAMGLGLQLQGCVSGQGKAALLPATSTRLTTSGSCGDRTGQQKPPDSGVDVMWAVPIHELGSVGAPGAAGCMLMIRVIDPFSGGPPGRAARVPPALHSLARPRHPRVHDIHYDLQGAGPGAHPERQGRGANPRALQARSSTAGTAGGDQGPPGARGGREGSTQGMHGLQKVSLLGHQGWQGCGQPVIQSGLERDSLSGRAGGRCN